MDTGQPLNALRVFLVEDAASVRRKIALLLGAIADVLVVGEAEDGETALAAIRQHSADVAVIDLRLAAGSGIDLIATLTQTMPRVITIALTNHSGPAFRAACKTAGAHYFFDKTAEFDAACRTIEALASTRSTRVADR
ncbi:response regulator transcription factor [Paraburkholderia edwinii]|jgi:DNA-binding NarL/FixJ family response regulator|uniref:Response regulator transcription factor n=1 Tax=Paraburkholderia edwinii TaxID=2861782 RepID=A0ABX8UIB7_9BURK|nr:response regulator transcription factor [Paraburkholderia edwinii]QYD68569.1 response regulator transcription factor [Paraburkholderia edwinii]